MSFPIPRFSTYWCGYVPADQSNKLTDIPTYINPVILGFAGLNTDSTMTTEFLCSKFTERQIKDWSRVLQDQGQKVFMSIMDSDTNPWTSINPDKFVASAVPKIFKEWKLDGIDFDGDGGAIECLKVIIPKFRAAVDSDVPLTYTCYQEGADADILETVGTCIDWVQTMWYSGDLSSFVQMAEFYANLVGKEKVLVGVSVRDTGYDLSVQIAQWIKENGYGGIMLWNSNDDNKVISGLPDWTYSNAISEALHVIN